MGALALSVAVPAGFFGLSQSFPEAEKPAVCFALESPDKEPRNTMIKGNAAERSLLAQTIGGMEGPLARLLLNSAACNHTSLQVNQKMYELGLYTHSAKTRVDIRPPVDYADALAFPNSVALSHALRALRAVAYEEFTHAFQLQQQGLGALRGGISDREAALFYNPAIEGAAKVAVFVAMEEEHKRGAAPSLADRVQLDTSSGKLKGPYNPITTKVAIDALKKDDNALTKPETQEAILLAFARSSEIDFYLLENMMQLVGDTSKVSKRTPLLSLLPKEDARRILSFGDYQKIATLPGQEKSFLSEEGMRQFRELTMDRLAKMTMAHLDSHVYARAVNRPAPTMSEQIYGGASSPVGFAKPSNEVDRMGPECFGPTVEEQFKRVGETLDVLIGSADRLPGYLSDQVSLTKGNEKISAGEIRRLENFSKYINENMPQMREALVQTADAVRKNGGTMSYQEKVDILKASNSMGSTISTIADTINAMHKLNKTGMGINYAFSLYTIVPEGYCDMYRPDAPRPPLDVATPK
jgi:hypothetical protein